MLWPTCGVVGLTFNETQAHQHSRIGEQSRRLVKAIAVCRSILAQVHSPPVDDLETGQAMLVAFLPSGWPFLVPARRHLGPFSRWAAVKPSVTSAILSVPTAVFIKSDVCAVTLQQYYPPLALENSEHAETAAAICLCWQGASSISRWIASLGFTVDANPPRSVVVPSHTQPMSTRRPSTFLERPR
jgi:hypothetical protein